MSGPRVGLTLPSFVRDPDEVYRVLHAAEDAGLDGAFCYDHLFRVTADGAHRPALEVTAMLGALAGASSRIPIGVLVARAALRPAALTALTLCTAQRVCGGRLIGGLGAGDGQSEAENEQYGVPFGTLEDRLVELAEAVRACRDQGFPVWVGGLHRAVRAIAADEADGWNRWGGPPERFAAQAAEITARAARRPFDCTWGGLVVLGPDDDRAAEKAARLGARPGTLVGGPSTVADALARYAEAGASWVIAGPVDSRDPANVEHLAEVRTRLA